MRSSDLHPVVRFIRVREVMQKTGLSKSGIYDLIARGSFPQKVSLGERSVAFVESEIDDWLIERMNERAKNKNYRTTNAESIQK
ncbi:helix-turn-helix transcriptional regulator [Plesiomonas shigelloides]|uniref:helix-turn-helix transcriptional regulator n=1 Tax=Plesiomonas shigelloides TaxID=703 RepID=UPI0012625602|nr:AlpA family transcriptional regulator [Plesiomonas shigelloides]KAB7695556.1 AlpA family phage regulatory protein [Plesiomonas shigelloides]